MKTNWSKAEKILKNGGVIIAPTDTLYGILACAEDKNAVQKIYKIKGRDNNKPFIILIASIKDLEKFGIENSNIKENMKMFPKGKKVSFILSCSKSEFKYLHRGTKSLAFRVVNTKNKNLFKLIQNTGSLVAPSANPQGLSPAKTITEAKKYFDIKIDLYINGGKRNSKPSTIISLLEEVPKILRK
ncbi:threonylcarbamoyl-AMP synthase [Candidatus Nomurabacteria bacterium]|nr:threonylcarbamoyl-AMP synthase [Candidatus Nomurabacteria bacterium]